MPLPSLGRLSTRSNLKAVNAGKHRNSAPAKDADEVVEDHELTSYLAALAPDADPESTGSGRRFGEAQVHQLRFSQVASEQLKDLAAERQTSPQALAQEWILERLSWESQAAEQHRYEEPQLHQEPQLRQEPLRRERVRQEPQLRQEPQWPDEQQYQYPMDDEDEALTDQHHFDQRWEQPVAGRL